MRSAATGLCVLTLLTVSATVTSATPPQRAADTCANAHAILTASKSGQHELVWRAVARTVRSDRDKWEVVDDYEPMVVRRVSFRQYDTRYVEGGTAYVAHCGHGGTCNALADAFAKEMDGLLPVPEVYCGVVPGVLDNPQPVTLPE